MLDPSDLAAGGSGEFYGAGSGGIHDRRGFWVSHFSRSGEAVWIRLFARSLGVVLDTRTVVAATADTVFAVASTVLPLTEEPIVTGFLAALDPSGRERWRRLFVLPGYPEPASAVAMPDGGVTLVFDVLDRESSEHRILLSRWTADGRPAWAVDYRTAGDYQVPDAALLPDGGMLVVGSVTPPSGDQPLLCMVRVDDAGAISKQRAWRGTSGRVALDLPASGGIVLLAGSQLLRLDDYWDIVSQFGISVEGGGVFPIVSDPLGDFLLAGDAGDELCSRPLLISLGADGTLLGCRGPMPLAHDSGAIVALASDEAGVGFLVERDVREGDTVGFGFPPEAAVFGYAPLVGSLADGCLSECTGIRTTAAAAVETVDVAVTAHAAETPLQPDDVAAAALDLLPAVMTCARFCGAD
jgi:hypothetical protein